MPRPRLSGRREPLGLWRHRVGPPAELPNLRCERIELSSRGDRVSGRMWTPRRRDGELPLVLVQHRAGASASDAEIESIALGLAEQATVVAAVDLPLHGARADAKLTELLRNGLAGDPGAAAGALVEEFERQAIVDLERTLDALTALPEIDAERVGFLGFGLGAELGAAFCSVDQRVRAVALAIDPAGSNRRGFEAQACIAAIAPRPLLQLRETRDGALDPDILPAALSFLVSELTPPWP